MEYLQRTKKKMRLNKFKTVETLKMDYFWIIKQSDINTRIKIICINQECK